MPKYFPTQILVIIVLSERDVVDNVEIIHAYFLKTERYVS